MTELTICTHSGTFHADEALACYLLKQTNKFKDAKIIRSRDTAVINAADVAVDVGATYDFSKLRFDHHQAGFTETFDDHHEIKLSSAGLIYKHYGKEIIKNRLKVNDEITDIIYKKDFIEELDGVDNGIERYPAEIKAKYKMNTTISQRVASMNPYWNEDQSEQVLYERFEKAMALMGETFNDKVDYYGKSWMPARAIVEEALRTRKEVHSSGQLIVLRQFCPWKEHLYHLEKLNNINKSILFCLFEDNLGSWRIQAVNLDNSSFTLRKALPEAWRGKRDQELSDIIGIDGYANGFIGGHKHKDGAMHMAIKALEN
ncbi:metal-dependent protein hydrolase domain-containing protein [Heterostelium album PN500]|uniref:Metal-dependent protein hydrolase domain-containing protein n=1 Tax=Heterostelium pallidum (strain ATCC 26659 / Pp 5 / PN500) TaxID=670386 RepID=D3BQU0_HETP5|nr:metal-dependent protein hydrolase domain-containing protein [Heterostelium album PN500]EFA76510.1 metal-dependent protein hydrolase domain-containing protein [Heterostelium album PN500]|eukprot:XP_020428642.1 metal-dependent protein hydrolase domain-containing protein [Heterostelium album PN500]